MLFYFRHETLRIVSECDIVPLQVTALTRFSQPLNWKRHETINIKKECTAFMKEFVCYRVKNLILPNIDIMKINRERKKKNVWKAETTYRDDLSNIW